MVQETSMRKVRSEERREPYNTLNGTGEKEEKRERENNNKINIVTVSLGKSVKNVALGREKGALQHPKQNRTDNIEEELSEKWTQNIKEDKRNTLSQRSPGFFVWGVFLTHPLLASFCGEFLLHILCWLLSVGSFSYTSCAGFFLWGVSLTHLVLASLCGEFLLHIPCWPLYIYVGYLSYISMPASLCW